MRVLITGSRDWTDQFLIQYALDYIDHKARTASFPVACTLVVGKCRGADQIGEEIARRLGWEIDPFPANWSQHGAAAGPLRNQEMVDSGADVCVAFPLGASRGTRDCIARARAAGIPVWAP